MNPTTPAKAQLFAGAQFMPYHNHFKGYLSVVTQDAAYKEMYNLVAIRTNDMFRLFGNYATTTRELYLKLGERYSVVLLKPIREGDNEVFGHMLPLPPDVVKEIFNKMDVPDTDFPEAGPDIRIVILANEQSFETCPVKDVVEKITQAEYDAMTPMKKFDVESFTWIANDDPIPVQKTLHLRDIPLVTRADRNLLRSHIKTHGETLNKAWVNYNTNRPQEEQLSFEDWMEKTQGVYYHALRQMDDIDEKKDDDFIAAIHAFKKAEVIAYHAKAVKEEGYEGTVYRFCSEKFNCELSEIGIAEATAEIEAEKKGLPVEEIMQQTNSVPEPEQDEEFLPGNFVVTFDGTVVENQRPIIGPESPYAVGLIRALLLNGHRVFILTDRKGEEKAEMLAFFEQNGVIPSGVLRYIRADEAVLDSDVEDKSYAETDDLIIDYLINHLHISASTIRVSSETSGTPTLFWGDIAQVLVKYGYLSEEEVSVIASDLIEAVASM